MFAARSKVVGVLRWIGGRRLILPFTAAVLRARTVRETPSFLARELTRARGIHLYHLRDSALRVAIRHGGGDPVTLGEIFHERYYEPAGAAVQGLTDPHRILDLGANIGLFGAFAASRWPASRITGYEPDPANAQVHERAMAANANQLADRWRLVRAAAGARDGTASLAAGREALSHLTDGTPTEGDLLPVAVADVLPEIAGVDLLKMDIEGGEWAILNDPRFALAPPRAVVLEYHPYLCPAPDARAAAVQALESAGLSTAAIWHRADGHGMLWAWRT